MRAGHPATRERATPIYAVRLLVPTLAPTGAFPLQVGARWRPRLRHGDASVASRFPLSSELLRDSRTDLLGLAAERSFVDSGVTVVTLATGKDTFAETEPEDLPEHLAEEAGLGDG